MIQSLNSIKLIASFVYELIGRNPIGGIPLFPLSDREFSYVNREMCSIDHGTRSYMLKTLIGYLVQSITSNQKNKSTRGRQDEKK